MNALMPSWRVALLILMVALCGCGGGADSGAVPTGTPPPSGNTPQNPAPPEDPEEPEEPTEEPPLVRMDPIRNWSFNVVLGNSFSLHEVASGTQTGGELQELIDFGFAVEDHAIPAIGFSVPADGFATGYIFGTADGGTYGLYVEAPFAAPGQSAPVGSDAQLEQRQSFIKRAENATLEYTITAVAASGFAQANSNSESPTTRIKSLIHLDIDAYVHPSRRIFYRRASAVSLLGNFIDPWFPLVQNFTESIAPLWVDGDFEFETGFLISDRFGEVRHGLLQLRDPRTYSVDLSGIEVGETFTLRSVAIVAADNRLGNGSAEDSQASAANAYLRDPIEIGGNTLRFTGLEPVNVDVPPPETTAGEPLPCTSPPAPNSAAGTLQFSAANYSIDESGSIPLDIAVTRTGGSSGAVSATLTAADGTAIAGVDYTALNTTVVFGDGDTTQRFVALRAIANAADEPNKTLSLSLSEPGGCAALGTQRTAAVTIVDDDRPQAQSFTIGGTVSGLVGTGLVIRDRNFLPLTPANGPFTFAVPVPGGLPYEVTIVSQPINPAQICTLNNASGVANANVTNVEVICATPPAVAGLDGSFGSAGKVTVGLPGGATATALQGDGKILAVGGMRLVRYESDGSIDGTFGTGGTVNVTFNGGAQDAAQDVAVQADGRILVAGFTRVGGNEDFAVARYNADGTPDTGFGTAGHANADFDAAADRAWSVLIQSDGHIVLAGHASSSTVLGLDNDFAVARFTSGGVLDSSFGTAGRSRTNIAGRTDMGLAAALQADDKIIVTGRVADSGGDFEDTGVVRYNANGTVDSGFNGGVVRTNLSVNGLDDQGVDVIVQADGKILIAGFAQANSAATLGHSSAFALSRLNANGSVDTAFGSAGLVTTLFTTDNDFGRGVALQSDGKIVVVGQRSNRLLPDFGIVRYLASGAPDVSFGTAGLFSVDFFGSDDDARDILVQPDGKLVVSGSATNGRSTAMGMVRINP